MLEKFAVQIVFTLSFFSLWYMGNSIDNKLGNALEGTENYTVLILVASVALLMSSFYLGRKSKADEQSK